MRATRRPPFPLQDALMSLKVAVISRDEGVRATIAECFDRAPQGWEVGLFQDRPVEADVVVRGPDVSTEADVVFDPARPEALLADIRAVTASLSKIFVVTGAGRGTGVTSLALHLARGLAAFRETCFIDLDTTWSGARDRLGLGAGTTMTWADAGESSDDLRLAALPMAGGFRALLAPRDAAPPAGLVQRVAGSFDRVVVDLPAGEHDTVLGEAASALLLVPPTPTGLARAGLLLRRPRIPWAVVISRSGHGGEVRRMETEELLGRKATVELPCTPALRDAEDRGDLLRGPWTRYNRRVARLAAGLDAL